MKRSPDIPGVTELFMETIKENNRDNYRQLWMRSVAVMVNSFLSSGIATRQELVSCIDLSNSKRFDYITTAHRLVPNTLYFFLHYHLSMKVAQPALIPQNRIASRKNTQVSAAELYEQEFSEWVKTQGEPLFAHRIAEEFPEFAELDSQFYVFLISEDPERVLTVKLVEVVNDLKGVIVQLDAEKRKKIKHQNQHLLQRLRLLLEILHAREDQMKTLITLNFPGGLK